MSCSDVQAEHSVMNKVDEFSRAYILGEEDGEKQTHDQTR